MFVCFLTSGLWRRSYGFAQQLRRDEVRTCFRERKTFSDSTSTAESHQNSFPYAYFLGRSRSHCHLQREGRLREPEETPTTRGLNWVMPASPNSSLSSPILFKSGTRNSKRLRGKSSLRLLRKWVHSSYSEVSLLNTS